MTRPPRLKAKPMAGRRGDGETRRRGEKSVGRFVSGPLSVVRCNKDKGQKRIARHLTSLSLVVIGEGPENR